MNLHLAGSGLGGNDTFSELWQCRCAGTVGFRQDAFWQGFQYNCGIFLQIRLIAAENYVDGDAAALGPFVISRSVCRLFVTITSVLIARRIVFGRSFLRCLLAFFV